MNNIPFIIEINNEYGHYFINVKSIKYVEEFETGISCKICLSDDTKVFVDKPIQETMDKIELVYGLPEKFSDFPAIKIEHGLNLLNDK